MDLGLRKFHRSNSFPDFFPKHMQIFSLTFLACKLIKFAFRCTSLIFCGIMGLRPSKFHRMNSFPDFFLYACRYCADFWHISQPPAFLKAIHTMTGTYFVYLEGSYLDFSHLTKLKHKSLFTKSHTITKRNFFNGVSCKGYIAP